MAKFVPAYGWVPDFPDHRDEFFTATQSQIQAVPPKWDLRKDGNFDFDIYDQGQLGSCTGNGIAAAIEYAQRQSKMSNPFIPSRLFIYYNERVIEGTVNSDNGAQIRDGLKTVSSDGVPPETSWPYDVNRFTVKPPPAVYTAAADRKVLVYRRVDQSLTDMKVVLSLNFPIVIGFSVFESFESRAAANSGDAPLPGLGERLKGGHCVLLVAYDDQAQRFTFRNSWGQGWGAEGYGTLPYAYLTNAQLARDFWTIELVQ
jgi:C1A family cysteine protease